MNCTELDKWSDDCKNQLTSFVLKNKNKYGSDITKEQAVCVQDKIINKWKNYGEFLNANLKDPQNTTQFVMDSIQNCKKSNNTMLIIICVILFLCTAAGVGYYFLKKWLKRHKSKKLC